RGRGIVVLSPLLHGPAARGRHAEAGDAALLGIHARARHLPVVSLRRSSPRRGRAPAEGARGRAAAHRPELGRQPPTQRARMVRPTNAGARGFSGHADLLLHARVVRDQAPSHLAAPADRGIRRVLRGDDPPLCGLTPCDRSSASISTGCSIAIAAGEARRTGTSHARAPASFCGSWAIAATRWWCSPRAGGMTRARGWSGTGCWNSWPR